jgi:hypothetical protein
MRQPYPWLQAYLSAHLDELKGLRNTPQCPAHILPPAQSFHPSATEELRRGRSQRHQERSETTAVLTGARWDAIKSVLERVKKEAQ